MSRAAHGTRRAAGEPEAIVAAVTAPSVVQPSRGIAVAWRHRRKSMRHRRRRHRHRFPEKVAGAQGDQWVRRQLFQEHHSPLDVAAVDGSDVEPQVDLHEFTGPNRQSHGAQVFNEKANEADVCLAVPTIRNQAIGEKGSQAFVANRPGQDRNVTPARAYRRRAWHPNGRHERVGSKGTDGLHPTCAMPARSAPPGVAPIGAAEGRW